MKSRQALDGHADLVVVERDIGCRNSETERGTGSRRRFDSASSVRVSEMQDRKYVRLAVEHWGHAQESNAHRHWEGVAR